MPVKNIRGVNINYRIVGDESDDNAPWLALITGGRRGHDEFIPLAEKIAAQGFRVLLHDRRNTGASDILIADEPGAEYEEEIWTDDLRALLDELGALPAFIGGSSSGARTSMFYALRHPETVRALVLLRVTGGPVPAARLPEEYYGQYVTAARAGGMAAICEMEQYAERIAANPQNRARLMVMDPNDYIATMSRWHQRFLAGANLPVMGVSEDQLKSISAPTLIIPGNDRVHSSRSAKIAHSAIPGAELHQLPVEDKEIDLIHFTEWAHLEPEIADTIAGFLHRQQG